MGCLDRCSTASTAAIEVRQDAHDEYNERLQARHGGDGLEPPDASRRSWYRNDDGEIYILSPWRLVDYWAWTKAPDPEHFELT